MATPTKVQCDYKQKIIDYFVTSDGTPVTVWLLTNKRSIKQYCEDTELPFKLGMRNLYDDMQCMQPRDLNEIYSERLKQ